MQKATVNKTLNPIKKLTLSAVLCALSLVLMSTIRFPIFPNATFYEMEFADVPILICSGILGPVYSIISLLVVCTIQTLVFSSGSGIIGFFMHFLSSGLMIIVVWILRNCIKGLKGVIISDILGVIVLTLVMIPMNMWMVSEYMKVSVSVFFESFLVVCVLFNLIKATCNLTIYSVIEKPVKKLFDRLR